MSALSILVLEDEALIALDLEYLLEDAGYENIAVFTSCADGKAYLEDHTPSVAILDHHLKDGTCTELAHTLASRKVPVIICSATEPSDLDGIFLHMPLVRKPWEPSHLLSALKLALGETTSDSGLVSTSS
jgi:DNA-binding response OmpR family regulator